MFIRIELENIATEATKETLGIFFSSPNGMCLCSKNACHMTPQEVIDARGKSVCFWYLDIDILNKYYGGALNSLLSLKRYPGVKSVDILPLECDPIGASEERYYEILSMLARYADGPVAKD